jgi:hypothetical protein
MTIVAFRPFATPVVACALRSSHDERVVVVLTASRSPVTALASMPSGSTPAVAGCAATPSTRRREGDRPAPPDGVGRGMHSKSGEDGEADRSLVGRSLAGEEKRGLERFSLQPRKHRRPRSQVAAPMRAGACEPLRAICEQPQVRSP